MPANQALSPALVDIWSRLPIELTREIILQLASTDIKLARRLRLISRATNVWVLPLLFRTLTFTSSEHITRFASVLLPKRRAHIPALKSNLHTFPRPLTSYSIESLALVINNRLPSIEVALAQVAPAFTQLKNLVITGQNLSSNAHWLRRHPIHPTNMIIPHFGSPFSVDYREPVFQSVSHLYTSTLVGYRNSFVTDLPRLTHLAVHTRLSHTTDMMSVMAREFLLILEAETDLQQFVLVLNGTDEYNEQFKDWMRALVKCFRYKTFIVLPQYRHPRLEWEATLEGKRTIWDRALAWRAIQLNCQPSEVAEYRAAMAKESEMERAILLERKYSVDWEIDLVQREGYVAYEGDPVERLYTSISFPEPAGN